jgi:hypothetical protein
MANIEINNPFIAYRSALALPETLKAKIAVADYAAVMCRNHQRSEVDWEYMEQLLQAAYGKCEKCGHVGCEGTHLAEVKKILVTVEDQ